MDAVSVFFGWQTLVFGIFIYVLVLGVRAALERVWPWLTESPYWRDIALPTLPALLGVAVALLVPTYPLPDSLSSPGARAIYGTVVGYLSAWMYRCLKAFVKQQWGDVESRTDTVGGGKP